MKLIEKLTDEELLADIEKGGRFVQYRYCIVLPYVYTISPTEIYYIPAGKWAIRYGWIYLLICITLGLGIGLIFYRQYNVTYSVLQEHYTVKNRLGNNKKIKETVWQINQDISSRGIMPY